MKTSASFWDSSALVPLCVRQDTSQILRQQWRRTTSVSVWSGASVELRSSFARLLRTKELTEKEFQKTRNALTRLRERWFEIDTDNKLYRIAEDLPDSHGLRALDSFQLAAALVWCNEKPKGRVFVCDDIRLCEAAKSIGFTVVP